MTARKDHLTVAVAPALPSSLTSLHIQTGQNSLIKPVHVAFEYDRAVELVLHGGIFPDLLCGQLIAAAGDFNQCCALAVAGRDEEMIGVDRDRLRDIDAHVGVPARLPEQRSVADGEPDYSIRADHHDLSLAREGEQHR